MFVFCYLASFLVTKLLHFGTEGILVVVHIWPLGCLTTVPNQVRHTCDMASTTSGMLRGVMGGIVN